jgi:hypothetical protein
LYVPDPTCGVSKECGHDWHATVATTTPQRKVNLHGLAVKMLDELRSCICEIYVDEGFNGPIYHFSFEEKAVQVAEKFLRTAEENQDDGRAIRDDRSQCGDNNSPAVNNISSAHIEVAPPLTEAPQPVPTDSHAQGTRYFCGICGETSEPCSHQRELAHAQGTTPATQKFVLIAQGEGAMCRIVDDLSQQTLHDVMCFCGKWETCEMEEVKEARRTVLDRDNWNCDEDGMQFSCRIAEYETGHIDVYVLAQPSAPSVSETRQKEKD